MTGRQLIVSANRGNEQAQEALAQAGYSPELSPSMNEIALETAIELFDEFSEEATIRVAA